MEDFAGAGGVVAGEAEGLRQRDDELTRLLDGTDEWGLIPIDYHQSLPAGDSQEVVAGNAHGIQDSLVCIKPSLVDDGS